MQLGMKLLYDEFQIKFDFRNSWLTFNDFKKLPFVIAQ